MLRFPSYVRNLLYRCSFIESIRNTLEIRQKFIECYRGAHRIQGDMKFQPPGRTRTKVALESRLPMDSWAFSLSWKSESWLPGTKTEKHWQALGLSAPHSKIPDTACWSPENVEFWRLLEFTFQLCYLITMWLRASYLTTTIFICKHGDKTAPRSWRF